MVEMSFSVRPSPLTTFTRGGKENYFLGSMVFITEKANSFEVVDGQQRLAVLSILFAAVRDAFLDLSDTEGAGIIDDAYLLGSLDIVTRKTTPKLTLNHSDNALFAKIIGREKDDLDMDKI